jgi:cysteine desulfurase
MSIGLYDIFENILEMCIGCAFDGPCIDANADVNAVSVGLPMCSLKRLPSNMHFCFKDVSGDSLLIMLDMNGICASSGSACAAGSIDPSHVLLAIGRNSDEAKGALRLSIDKDLTMEDADYAIDALKAAVARLRR